MLTEADKLPAKFKDPVNWWTSSTVSPNIVEPLLKVKEIQGANVAEIGIGSGRLALMLAEAQDATLQQ